MRIPVTLHSDKAGSVTTHSPVRLGGNVLSLGPLRAYYQRRLRLGLLHGKNEINRRQRNLLDDGCLARLTVTNNELSLASTDWNHRINTFQSGLNRLINVLSSNNTWRYLLYRRSGLGIQSTFAVDRVTQRVHDATQQFRTCRYF